MTVTRRMKGAGKAQFGSIASAMGPGVGGSQLRVRDAAYRYSSDRHFTLLMSEGKWMVKSLPAREREQLVLNISVTGTGRGVLYATALGFDDKPTYLFVQRVSGGQHQVAFDVPFKALRDFKLKIGTKLPAEVSTDFLSDQDVKGISSNMLLLRDAKPSYQSPGLGFTGGVMEQMESLEQAAAKGGFGMDPVGGKSKSGKDLWNGQKSGHSWKKHGFTYPTSTGVKGLSTGPMIYPDYYGYTAYRASTYVALFNDKNEFMGWDANENTTRAHPAGVPLCVMLQLYHHSHKTLSGAGARNEFTPKWKWMSGVKIPRTSIGFVQSWVLVGGSNQDGYVQPGGAKSRQVMFTKSGVPAVHEGGAFDTNLGKGAKIVDDFTEGGTSFSKKDFRAKVEWFNRTTGTWSPPQESPPEGAMMRTDKYGATFFVARFPRQLDPVADKKEIDRVKNAGGPDYSWNATKYCYPYIDRKNDKKGYYLLGRVQEGQDSDSALATSFTETINGETFAGRRDITYQFMSKLPSKSTTGKAAPGYYSHPATALRIADPAKHAYIDSFDVTNTYYVAGEFTPGDTVVVLGKALGSIGFNNCVISKDGNDYPDKVYARQHFPAKFHPREINDGSAGGTTQADYLEIAGHITADDLEDEKNVSGETALLATWKKIFGKDLSGNWFREFAGEMKNQDPNNPLHYLVTKDGQTYSFPYSIAWFKIPMYYTGPIMDYNEEGKIHAPEGKPFAVKSASDPVYILARTPFKKYTKQKWSIVGEIEVQKQLEEAGFEEDAAFALNQMDYETEDVTEIVEDHKEETRLLNMQPPAKEQKKREKLYTDSWWKANFVVGNQDTKTASELGLQGFSRGGNFTVEDVTDKWGTINGLGSAPSYENTAMDMNIYPESFDSVGSDPFLNIGMLGGAAETAGEVFYEAVDTAWDVLSETVEAVVDPAGKADEYKSDGEKLIDDLSGFGSLQGLGEISPETQEKIQKIEDKTAVYAAYGKALTTAGRETFTGAAPASLTDWYSDNQPYSTLLLVGLGIAAIPFVGSTVFGNLGRAPGALAGGLVQGTGDLATGVAKTFKRARRLKGGTKRRKAVKMKSLKGAISDMKKSEA